MCLKNKGVLYLQNINDVMPEVDWQRAKQGGSLFQERLQNKSLFPTKLHQN